MIGVIKIYMDYSRERIAALKKQYPKNTRIELQQMTGESDMPKGLKGTVKLIDDAGQIHVDWDNGRQLALVPNEDSFSFIEQPNDCNEENSESQNFGSMQL